MQYCKLPKGTDQHSWNRHSSSTDWMEKVKRKTFCLVTVMQQAFLRHKVLFLEMGIDLFYLTFKETFGVSLDNAALFVI